MKSKSRLLSIMLLAIMLAGAIHVQPLTMTASSDSLAPQMNESINWAHAGFDSQNISVSLVSPTNRSETSGLFDITIDITSDFANNNVTLFINNSIYSGYNKVLIGTGNQILSNIDTTTVGDGNLNFTILLEYKDVTWDEKESIYLEYFVDNYGPNLEFDLLSPANESLLIDTASLLINVTSDFDFVNFTLLIEGEAYPSYNGTTIAAEPQVIQVDTTTIREGWLNFTLVFDYNVVNLHETYDYYLRFHIDNDGQPITLSLLSPTNQSQVSGEFNLTVDLESDYGPVNLTLFVDGVIEYPQYNKTLTGLGANNLTLNTTILNEGSLNFTILLEYNVTGENANITYHLVYIVNNHGSPSVTFLYPDVGADITGLDFITLNISSTYEFVNLTITIDGEITPEYNHTLVPSGVGDYEVNGSRYENGHQVIEVLVETVEGLHGSTSREFYFIDYVRFQVIGLTSFDRVSGLAQIDLRIATPYPNVTLSAYVDEVLVPNVVNITLPSGNTHFMLNTTVYTEGEHTFTFRAYSIGDHVFKYSIILEVDNHGAPTVSFVSPKEDVIVGLTTFTINIDSTWDMLNLTVSVDGEEVTDLVDLRVNSGNVIFQIDTGMYSKWEHTVEVLVTTDENLEGSAEETFGFANVKVEEVISLVIILVVAFIFPFRKWREGGSITPVLLADALFAVIVFGLFFAIGVNSIPFAIWHINMASIWSIGAALVFTNWLIPLAMETEQE